VQNGRVDVYRFRPGTRPVVVSLPHDGVYVPPEIARRMTPEALRLPDTDWHVSRLYDFASELGVSLLVATHSRYVVDLNRDPKGVELYPGASNTEICPTATFDSAPIYRRNRQPDAAEIEERIARFFVPYHDRLRLELSTLRETHGVAVMLDGHSIRSVVPRFFEGVLPDLNLGTAAGKSAATAIANRAMAVLSSFHPYSFVRDGRFKGGYITRSFGLPERNVHALQLELAQKTYMDEAYPYTYRPERADKIIVVLRRLVEELVRYAKEHGR